MTNNGLTESTVKNTNKALVYLSKRTNLEQPEIVKNCIANLNVTNGTKRNLCIAYNKYAKHYKIEWQMPLYQAQSKQPKIPTEERLNQLIAGTGTTLSTKLQLSKETGLRPIELCNLQTKDIDFDQRTVTPRTAKHGAPRTLRLSQNLTQRIKDHVTRHNLNFNDKLFHGDAENYAKHYRIARNALAKKLKDPSIQQIRLYDFRHYFATTTYHRTKDILYTKAQMGHKKIETTLIYTQLLDFTKDDEYTCKVAKNEKELTELIEHGFEYVTEIDGHKILRKRK